MAGGCTKTTFEKPPSRVREILGVVVCEGSCICEVFLADAREEAVVAVTHRAECPNHIADVDRPEVIFGIPRDAARQRLVDVGVPVSGLGERVARHGEGANGEYFCPKNHWHGQVREELQTFITVGH